MQLLAMGFEEKESKRALRACKSLDAAVTYIADQRIQQEERKKKEKQDRDDRREVHRLGKTRSGYPVHLPLLRGERMVWFVGKNDQLASWDVLYR